MASRIENSPSWQALANALGVTRKSLQRWRETFAEECPETRSVADWHRFMVLKGLKRADEALTKGEISAVLRGTFIPKSPSPPSRVRESLFALLDTVHAEYSAGRIDLEQYFQIGEATVELVVDLGEALSAGIDAGGYRKTWREIIVGEALKKRRFW